ncbi:MAG: sigma-70 family RNA polymerase sigma factor [Anaerolineales bacterium]|nr:sigma-70 family RNA polymerase sigma factor [Anaerolineales bacterium]
MPTDQALLRRARHLEEDALVEIYTLYSSRVYRYALRLLGNADLAEECVAETFSRFLKALSRGGGPQDYLRAYLYRIAHNWVVDHSRRKPVEALDDKLDMILLAEDNLLADLEQGFERLRIARALRRLRPAQRQVIVLRYLEDCTNEEIARVMERPVGAVKALRQRALANLRQILIRENEQGDLETPTK